MRESSVGRETTLGCQDRSGGRKVKSFGLPFGQLDPEKFLVDLKRRKSLRISKDIGVERTGDRDNFWCNALSNP
ncbi:hypothetical protein QR680_014199 [Steinernema hermaphroditum]|uniref:Uncharacterized protein n=1 Tax=Steinernema hermaphroditum TaxID=289476 RepID=A0AA39M3T1_9BILA|nr:hypothetical protein QR680_014199 [Steinernema hermaphroditum]